MTWQAQATASTMGVQVRDAGLDETGGEVVPLRAEPIQPPRLCSTLYATFFYNGLAGADFAVLPGE